MIGALPRRRFGRLFAALVALAVGLLALPAAAKVTQVNDRGFVVRLTALVPAGADKAWDEMLNPADWWDSEHTFSGSAANLAIDPKPGGCFCETLPGAEPGSPPRGGVEHMVVVYIEKPHALRMRGALGPLQGDALVGTLTMQLKPADGGGTQILWEYVVGGYLRVPVEGTATGVDQMLGEQLGRFAAKLGAKPDAVPPSVSDDAKPAGPPAESSAPAKPDIIGR